jgi:hypothetical protein
MLAFIPHVILASSLPLDSRKHCVARKQRMPFGGNFVLTLRDALLLIESVSSFCVCVGFWNEYLLSVAVGPGTVRAVMFEHTYSTIAQRT